MPDAATSHRRRELVHEPPVPGWPPRPPAPVLRRSRLETYRLRQLARLQQRHPAWHARVLRLQAWHRRVLDRVLPRGRILALTLVVLGLTLFDALATVLVVGLGVAEEANPLLAGLIERIGLAPAMAVRVVIGGGFTLALAWLSTWRREARPVLVLVAVVLSAVACLHVAGMATTLL